MPSDESGDWRTAAEVFHEWALMGKDVGMEKGHEAAVDEMLAFAISEIATLGKRFHALDVGCGNGWVVRKLASHPHCSRAVGIDAAPAMIDKARELDTDGEYHLVNLLEWSSEPCFDLIHSMETMYYLEDPGEGIKHLTSLLTDNGLLLIGVDHYAENESSLDWPHQVKTKMTTMSSQQWISCFEMAGLNIVRIWKAAPREDWLGTLVIAGRK
jgi:predicted TPR repeat methyltransferase